PTPLVRRTLAHELTHALQDQHFSIYRPELDKRDDESPVAFSALLEGDARRVEQAYENTLSAADRSELAREQSAQLAQLPSSDRPTPLVRRTLAHELTHALQDQHFSIYRPELDKRDDESPVAFSALLEGDARRVEQAYENTLSAADRSELAREQSAQLAQLPS